MQTKERQAPVIRLLGSIHVHADEAEALTVDEEKALRLCPPDKHRMNPLGTEIDGMPVQRCMRCGVFEW